MSERRRALGKGLGALIPSGTQATSRPVDVFFPVSGNPYEDEEARAAEIARARPSQSGDSSPRESESVSRETDVRPPLVEVPGAEFAYLDLDDITPNRAQPRRVFDEEELSELAHSIAEIGVLQPIVVRPYPNPQDGDAPFELVMGERRWRAARTAGESAIPAIIRSTSEDDLLRDALLENLHRAQLNPLEEAAAYQQLLEDFGCTQEELSRRIARSRPQISNTLRLLRLPPQVQRRLAAGVLSAGHARALLGLADGAGMERLAQRIVAEGLSVRATEEIVSLGDAEIGLAQRAPRAGSHSPALVDLGGRLGDRFETRVKVSLGKRKGNISIEFATVEDLNRILGVLAPEDPGVFR